MFYQRTITQANIQGNRAGVFLQQVIQSRQYVGAPVSPDAVAQVKSWFTVKKVSDQLSLDTISPAVAHISSRPITGSAGTGKFLSFKDLCRRCLYVLNWLRKVLPQKMLNIILRRQAPEFLRQTLRRPNCQIIQH
jgi:hypothetical protein